MMLPNCLGITFTYNYLIISRYFQDTIESCHTKSHLQSQIIEHINLAYFVAQIIAFCRPNNVICERHILIGQVTNSNSMKIAGKLGR